MENLKQSQILTSNYPYYKYSLDYAFNSLERMGAKEIEFYAVFPHFHIDDIRYDDVKILKRKVKEHGLSVKCLTPEQCLYPVNIAAKDPAARMRSLEVFKKSIQCAGELGAELVVTLAGYAMLDEKEEQAWQRSVESLGILGDYAKTYGIELVLETSPREYTTTHTAKDAVRMIKEVGSASIKGMVDTATLGYSGETMEEVIQDLGPYLRHVHIADGVPNGHLILGKGNLDLYSMLEKLDQAKYTYGLSLEILNDQYMRNPHEAMEESFLKLREWLR